MYFTYDTNLSLTDIEKPKDNESVHLQSQIMENKHALLDSLHSSHLLMHPIFRPMLLASFKLNAASNPGRFKMAIKG